MQVDAVIFDMDGLLMDSESCGLVAMHDAGLRQGYDLPYELMNQMIGITSTASSAKFRAVYPEMDTTKLFADFKALMHERAAAGTIPMKKGAMALLRYLQERSIPTAVASSSAQETIQLYMRSVQAESYFNALLSGRNMASKPAPDVFLHAAQQLNADPSRCLVLEDSYNGVKAGRAAGMQVCMIPDLLPYQEELAPYVDHVLPDLDAVIGLL